jgi:RNase H-like domain found in reverse transcriptase
LAQERDGKVHPVAYCSRRLSEPERRLLFPTEFEALAVVYVLDAFRWAVFGHRVTVVTDHSALKWLFTLKVSNGKLLRWAMRVLEYDALKQHRPGKQHGNADMLSRFGTTDEPEPAVVDCEDGLREMPEEGGWGPISMLAVAAVELSSVDSAEQLEEATERVTGLLHQMQATPVAEVNTTTAAVRYITADGYLLDLAAGEPARMTLATTEDEELVSSEGIDIARSVAPRQVYHACREEHGTVFDEDSAAGVLVVSASRGPIKTPESTFPLILCTMDGVLWAGVTFTRNSAEPTTGPQSWLPEGQRLMAVLSKLEPVILTRPSKSGIITSSEQQRCTWVGKELGAWPSVYNLAKYNGSEELLKGAVLISADEAEQLEWQQRGGVFILHKTAESTVLALRAVRQARATAVTRAASAVSDKAQQGTKGHLRPTAQRELKKRRVAVDVEQCAWWAVAVEGSSSSNGGSFPPYTNRPNVWGLNNDGLSGYTSKGLKRGANNDKVQGQDNLLCNGVHLWRERGSGEQAVGEQPHKTLLATVTAAGEKPSPS